jgi:hypothetical protein
LVNTFVKLKPWYISSPQFMIHIVITMWNFKYTQIHSLILAKRTFFIPHFKTLYPCFFVRENLNYFIIKSLLVEKMWTLLILQSFVTKYAIDLNAHALLDITMKWKRYMYVTFNLIFSSSCHLKRLICKRIMF